MKVFGANSLRIPWRICSKEFPFIITTIAHFEGRTNVPYNLQTMLCSASILFTVCYCQGNRQLFTEFNSWKDCIPPPYSIMQVFQQNVAVRFTHGISPFLAVSSFNTVSFTVRCEPLANISGIIMWFIYAVRSRIHSIVQTTSQRLSKDNRL